jgi:CRP/FNR family transcriptional regulator, cyclic AMP receptor protein
METDAIKKFILQIPFFKAFTDHELNKLIGREKVFKDCAKGGYIFKEGDPGNAIFVLLFGQIDLVKKGEDGKESIILQLKSGALFGEVAMLTGNKRNLDARASSVKAVVMEFNRDLIDKMIPSVQNKFQKQLLLIIAGNLDKMNMRYAKLEHSIEVREKLAEAGDI